MAPLDLMIKHIRKAQSDCLKEAARFAEFDARLATEVREHIHILDQAVAVLRALYLFKSQINGNYEGEDSAQDTKDFKIHDTGKPEGSI